MKRCKGFLALEYAMFIAIVIFALLGMSGYFRKALCGNLRSAADTFGGGRQYSPGKTVEVWERQ